jgi:hypothetical protein
MSIFSLPPERNPECKLLPVLKLYLLPSPLTLDVVAELKEVDNPLSCIRVEVIREVFVRKIANMPLNR